MITILNMFAYKSKEKITDLLLYNDDDIICIFCYSNGLKKLFNFTVYALKKFLPDLDKFELVGTEEGINIEKIKHLLT